MFQRAPCLRNANTSILTHTRTHQTVAIELHTIGMGLVKANRARRMTVPDALARLQVLVEEHLRAADASDTVECECVV
jgi:hypothetical protein